MVRNYQRKTEDRWSKQDLLRALTSVKDKTLTMRAAATKYGISRATMYRQYSKFLKGGSQEDVGQFRTCGGNPILTSIEEGILDRTVKELRGQGHVVNSTHIRKICFTYCETNGIPNQFRKETQMASEDWYYGFLKRHPDLKEVPIPKRKKGGRPPGRRTKKAKAGKGAGASATTPATAGASEDNEEDELTDVIPSDEERAGEGEDEPMTAA